MNEENKISSDQKEQAARFLASNAVAKLIGMRLVDIGPMWATIAVDMRDDLRQPHGLLHGGITATLIDTAMAFAVVTCLGEGEKASTIDLTVHYMRPHTAGTFTCTGRVLRAGKRIFTVTADVVNEDGKLIATSVSTYTKV